MQSERKVKLYQEDTVGDGNCAFNAFILGFCQEAVLDALESQINPDAELKDFIDRSATALETESRWQAVRDKMLALRQTNKRELQKKLAPVMRYLAIDQANKNPRHIEKTYEPLVSAFQNHVHRELGVPMHGVSDDIFGRHDFINHQFAELTKQLKEGLEAEVKGFAAEYKRLSDMKKRTDAEAARLDELKAILASAIENFDTQLLFWWDDKGHQLFLREMSRDAVWAGDLELSELAAYFHVNLSVTRGDFEHPMHIHHGVLLRKDLDEDEVHQLHVRGIIDRPEPHDTELRLMPLTREQVATKMSAVPEVGKVYDEMDGDRYVSDDVRLLKTPLSADLGHICQQELVKRDIIARDKGKKEFYFTSLTYSEIEDRIAEIQRKDQLLAMWDAHHRDAPNITLTNPSANHWSNMSMEVIPAEKIEPRTIVKAFSETLLMIHEQKIKPSSEKWEVFVEQKIAEEAKPVAVEKSVEYTISQDDGGKVVTVSVDTQIELDAELAKRLQAEEYEHGLSKELQEDLDRQLAERLQAEENLRLRK